MRTSSLLAALVLSFGLGCAGQTPRAHAAPPSDARTAPVTAAAAPKAANPVIPMPVTEASDAELQRLAGSILVGGRSFEYVRDLSELHGPRLTGSPVLAAAARWAVESFKRAGIDNAKIEEFTIPHGWERREARARIIGPVERPLRIAAGGWSKPTPAEGIRGQVLVVQNLEETVALRPEELRGKILLLTHRAFERMKKGAFTRSVEPLRKAGIAAILQHQKGGNHVLSAHKATYRREHFVSPFTCADISLEDGAALERAAEKGAVTVEIVSTSPVLGPVNVPNVVAELRGSERPEEIVIVGGHLDAWDFGTGSQDNGSGVAQVLEAARAIRALGRAPRRTIRFVLWGGEEQGLLGSFAYVKAHASELDRVVAVLNTDFGAGAPKGWTVDDPNLVKRFEPRAKAVLSGLGAETIGNEMRCDTDHCPFWLAGVPTLNLDVDTSHYFEIHHQSSDTIDKIAPGALASGAAVVAVTTFVLADSKERLAPRLDHAKVVAKLKEDKPLFDMLVLLGEFVP